MTSTIPDAGRPAHTLPHTAKVAVFSTQGRTFIIPGCWYRDGPLPPDAAADEEPSPSSVIIDAMTYSVTTGSKYEWRDFPLMDGDRIDFGRLVRGNLLSRAFAHGGFTVYFLSGPEFDEDRAEADDSKEQS